MAAIVSSVFERLELKYIIDEYTAGEVQRSLRRFCEPDPFNRADPASDLPGYSIFSLYLDNHTRALHEAKVKQQGDRIKLRVRTYDDHSHAHLEIKRKTGDVIHKTRVTVARHLAQEACAGFAPPLRDRPMDHKHLNRFAFFCAKIGAVPSAMIRYQREAWASLVDDYARVTFDRRIAARAPLGLEGWNLSGHEGHWFTLDDHWLMDGLRSPVILGLKCQTRVPRWMSELIQHYELQRTGFSKYGLGVTLIQAGERGLEGRQAFHDEDED